MSKRERSPENPFLVQMLFRYTGGTGNSCQAFPHREFAPAVWEVYFYQTAEQALDVVQQGVEQEQLHQMKWDEACREQDTLGVRVHHTMYIREACACQARTTQAGEAAASLTIRTEHPTSGP